MFAGEKRKADLFHGLSQAEHKFGLKLVCLEIDICRGSGHDVLDESLWSSLLSQVTARAFQVVCITPPCNSFSRATYTWTTSFGPRPIRSAEFRYGFPWLSSVQKQKALEGNRFVELTIEMILRCMKHDVYFLCEHPEDLGRTPMGHPASIWQWPQMQQLTIDSRIQTFAFHQCQFEAPSSKPTRFLTDLDFQPLAPLIFNGPPQKDTAGWYVGPLPAQCGHDHPPLIGEHFGQWRTASSASYPPNMCKWIADAIISNVLPTLSGGEAPSSGSTMELEETTVVKMSNQRSALPSQRGTPRGGLPNQRGTPHALPNQRGTPHALPNQSDALSNQSGTPHVLPNQSGSPNALLNQSPSPHALPIQSGVDGLPNQSGTSFDGVVPKSSSV